jgi:uncharacterized protein (TIGR02680 family)
MTDSPASEFELQRWGLSIDVPLPAPMRERWQPLRSGVVNLYRYDVEEFHYAEGRLLLRGNNGSGKSRVLALQLPFLLDGEVTPARVEPDGDVAKRIEWNLLMGRHKDRTGYSWIEFGRRAADGTVSFCTLGCGLRAVEGHTGLHSRWFFVTARRIGRDFFLLNEQRIPFGRERLAEQLGTGGRVLQKADDYRRAVDEALFGLGPRYGALIDLLLRLRRPQLTRKLDENELPEALSEALPTLSATIVDEVAESFRGLQADKDTLRDFVSTRDAVGAFLREYAGYLRIAVRRRAAEVRTSQSAYEHTQRSARDAQTRLDEASAALALLAAVQGELQMQLAAVESDERTLAESPEMKTADEIRRAREGAEASAQTLAVAHSDESAANRAAALASSRLRQAEEAAAVVIASRDTALDRTAAAALAADLAGAHNQHLPSAETGLSGETPLARVLGRRHEAMKLLRECERTVHAAEAALIAAEHALSAAQSAATSFRETEHNAREELDTRAAALSAAYRTWHESVRHLRPAPPSELSEPFALWLERREGQAPFQRAAEVARDTAVTAFAARAHALDRSAVDLAASIELITAEIERLEHGETPPPPPPSTRRSARLGRSGAPLWQLCDFHPALEPTARAGLEAALQSSGLLDAWLLPDGRLMAPDEDSFLVHSATHGAPVSPSLANLLVPTLDSESPAVGQVSPDTLARVFSAIGAAPDVGQHWVSTDGAWRLGPLAGRWSKPEAEFLGEATRAAARRRQIASLRARRTDSECTLAQNRSDRAALADERTAAAAEFAASPSDESLRRAGFALENATRLVAAGMLAEEKAMRNADLRRNEHSTARDLLQRDATDLGLAAWIGRFDALAEATQVYATALAGLWPTLRHAEAQTAQLRLAQEHHLDATNTLELRKTRRNAAAAEEAAARQRFETLRVTHGQTVAQVLEKHASAVGVVTETKRRLEENQTQRFARTAAQSTARAELTAAEDKRLSLESTRRTTIARLRELAEQHILTEAAPTLDGTKATESWSVTHAVDLARALEGALNEVPGDLEIWRQRQDQVHSHIQELRDRLVPHGHQPETHQLDELVLVRCHFQARPHTMTELHAAFEAEIAARGRLLQEREREIIENHLLAEAAVELQKMIRAAEVWRAAANEEMHKRPTSTGVRFRFQWEADTDIRFHEIRPILLRKGELWSPGERTAVSAFLQARIASEQATDESGSWRDHLARALDYRRWHRFVIERQQEGQWRRLNKATYGTGSGGEKALALTLPRFAAAAAHYTGASPYAPRLVMLDEAFAGIDPTMRAQCLGVLTQFDLDVVMTSELEWGCYTTVPALAIYHLTTLPGLDAVASTRWLWNGREKRQLDHPEPAATPPRSTDTLPAPYRPPGESSP